MEFKEIINKIKWQIGISISVLLLFLVIGVIGYMILEDYTFLESVWFTVITLTSIGYGTVRPLSDVGMIFTIFLILCGTSFVLYFISILASVLLDKQLIIAYNILKMEKKMGKLEDHIIICGFGRNGRQAARKLKQYNKSFVVIDTREMQMETHEGLENTLYIKGNATEESNLEKANISKASFVICTIPSDADNLFVVMTAKQMNPNVKIISRASNSSSINKLKIAGANNVILPDKIGGDHMASLIVTPDLIEFIDNIFIEGSKSTNLVELFTNNLDQSFINQTLRDLKIFKHSGCNVIGYKNPKNEYIINPDATQIIEKDSSFIILGRPNQVELLKEFYTF